MRALAATTTLSTRRTTLALAASAAVLALTAGCSFTNYPSTPFNDPSGGIPPTTELALSPNGQQLLVSWREKANKTPAKLLTLSGTTVTNRRDVALPGDTFTTAWSRSEHDALVTTFGRNGSELLRIDLRDDARTSLYKSASMLRFPLQVGEDSYVFLEAKEPGGRFHLWQRLQAGQKAQLSDQLYNMAGPLQHIQGSLLLVGPMPMNPATIRVFEGKLPSGLQSLIDAATWTVNCADNNPRTCIRKRLHFGPDGRTFGTMDLFNGAQRCEVAGRWIDANQVELSRDGSTVVFHAALTSVSGPRALYVIRNDKVSCTPVQIDIRESK